MSGRIIRTLFHGATTIVARWVIAATTFTDVSGGIVRTLPQGASTVVTGWVVTAAALADMARRIISTPASQYENRLRVFLNLARNPHHDRTLGLFSQSVKLIFDLSQEIL
ncbi:MAG: hypothetical protein IPP88_20630 [Betaproteobacteria bacterium]|nr:hypothetical protein [Betaproteobacteria bacterium]